jgi:hypothetical protein
VDAAAAQAIDRELQALAADHTNEPGPKEIAAGCALSETPAVDCQRRWAASVAIEFAAFDQPHVAGTQLLLRRAVVLNRSDKSSAHPHGMPPARYSP